MFQITWIRQITGKVLQYHACIVHDISIQHSRVIRGGDSLCSDGNTKYLFFIILICGNEFFDFIGDLLIVIRRVGIWKWNGIGRVYFRTGQRQ